MTACPHRYANVDDCARCAPRDVAVIAPARRHVQHTRWHSTGTTLGPGAKVAITLAMGLPTLFFLAGFLGASKHVENTFLIVPLSTFSILDVVILREVWERGRR